MAKKVKLTNENSQKADEIIAFHGYSSIEELMGNLEKPRKVMLMVKAGKPVDSFIKNIWLKFISGLEEIVSTE